MKKFFYKSIAVAASTIYISFMPMSVIASSESITPAIPNHNLLNSEEVIIPDGYFEKREHIMIEFEPQAFEILIDKIVVKENILEFHIIGGLKFTEEV